MNRYRLYRLISEMLIVATLAPTLVNLQRVVEPSEVVVCNDLSISIGGRESSSSVAPSQKVIPNIQLKTITLSGLVIVRVKIVRLLTKRPIPKSESLRHSEMWTGEITSMRI